MNKPGKNKKAGLADYSFRALPTKTRVLEYHIEFPKKTMPGIGGTVYFHREAFGRPWANWVIRVAYRTDDGKILLERVANGSACENLNPNSFLDDRETREMVAGLVKDAVSSAATAIRRKKKEAQEMAAEFQKNAEAMNCFEKSARRINETIKES